MPLSSSQFDTESLSSSQFGAEQNSPGTPAPLSLSASTTGSAAQATVWRNKSLGEGRPLAYSRKTAGTTFNWDDSKETTLPASDKGAGRI
jgi:hypothetical protein